MRDPKLIARLLPLANAFLDSGHDVTLERPRETAALVAAFTSRS